MLLEHGFSNSSVRDNYTKKKNRNFKSKNSLVCESGLPVPDIVTVVKPEDDELVT